MRRRDLLLGMGSVGVTHAALAHQPARIGILRASLTPDRLLDALRRGLVASGYTENQRYRHVIGATLVGPVEDGCVRAVSTFIVARIMHTGETTLFATGRYDDHIVVDDRKALRFADKVVILDSRQIDTLLAIPL